MREILGPETEEYLDEEAEEVRDQVEGVASTSSRVSLEKKKSGETEEREEEEMAVMVGRRGNWVAVGGVTGYNWRTSRKGKEREVFESSEDEVRACFHNLRGSYSLPLSPLCSSLSVPQI